MSRRKLSIEDRTKILMKTGGFCAYCGTPIYLNEMQVDHIEAVAIGGADDLQNMLPACRSCNHYKATCSLEVFRQRLEKMPDVLLRDSVTYKNAVRFGLVLPNKKSVTFYFETINKIRRKP